MWLAFLREFQWGEPRPQPRGDPSGCGSRKGKGPEAGSGQECREPSCRKRGTQVVRSEEKRLEAWQGEPAGQGAPGIRRAQAGQ